MHASAVTDPSIEALTKLGLERHALELEVCGYTVVENAIDPDVTARGLEATLNTFAEREGRMPNIETGEHYEGYWVSRCLLQQDPVFEQIVMAEKVLALVDYTVGNQCLLSTLTGHMRGQGGGTSLPTGYLPLHGDDTSPQPHPNYHNSVTVNICLTDLTEESGCLAFVPGSHRRLRQPSPGEAIVAGEGANEEIVPLEAPAGSAAIWPAHTWHGSWESKTPGLRVTLAELFSRPHIQVYEMFRETVSDEMLDRNSERFGSLMGMDTINGWNQHKDDWGKPWRDRDRSRYSPRVVER